MPGTLSGLLPSAQQRLPHGPAEFAEPLLFSADLLLICVCGEHELRVTLVFKI